MTTAETSTILRRVQALLAKAASTEFEEEAEALRVKANELIVAHSITGAMLAANGRKIDDLSSVRINIVGTYSHNQATLLSYISTIFNCKTIHHSKFRGSKTISAVTVIGYASDLQIVEGLFRIINTQAIHECALTDVPHWEHGRSYRNSWWFGFNRTIYKRLKAVHDSVVAQAPAATGGTSAALVLVDRAKRVELYRDELFGDLKKMPPRHARSTVGYQDGKVAGARADIGQSSVSSQRQAIK